MGHHFRLVVQNLEIFNGMTEKFAHHGDGAIALVGKHLMYMVCWTHTPCFMSLVEHMESSYPGNVLCSVK